MENDFWATATRSPLRDTEKISFNPIRGGQKIVYTNFRFFSGAPSLCVSLSIESEGGRLARHPMESKKSSSQLVEGGNINRHLTITSYLTLLCRQVIRGGGRIIKC